MEQITIFFQLSGFLKKKKKLKQILKNVFFIASISLECNLTPNFQNHRSIDNGGDGFCGQKKITIGKDAIEVKIEGKRCSQLMRQYPFLAIKTFQYVDLSMDLSCKRD